VEMAHLKAGEVRQRPRDFYQFIVVEVQLAQANVGRKTVDRS
jgi:hypothetical protein